VTDLPDFFEDADTAELDAQQLLEESGLGQPPGRYIDDFLRHSTWYVELDSDEPA
jgi:hypothetical protein